MKLKYFSCLILLGVSAISNAQVRFTDITKNTTAPNSSAFLDASSASDLNNTTNIGKGLLYPRVDLSTFSAFSGTPTGIATSYPTFFDGFIVYNTASSGKAGVGSTSGTLTPGFWFYENKSGTLNGGTWKNIKTNDNLLGWAITGNSGTSANTNFLGTSDDTDLVFKRNAIASGLLSNKERNTSFGFGSFSKGLWGGVGANSEGGGNTAFGHAALGFVDNTQLLATENTAIGAGAGSSITSSRYNVIVGTDALSLLKTNTWGNVAIGHSALRQYDNPGNTTNVVGDANTAVGMWSQFSSKTGLGNVSLGGSTLYNNISGNYNVAIGGNALTEITTGASNTALGFKAGQFTTTGSNNIFIGANTNATNVTASNELNIGNIIFGKSLTGTSTAPSGNIGIKTSNPGVTLDVNGGVRGTSSYNVSDKRLKKNIQNEEDVLKKLNQLRPVTYNWNENNEFNKKFENSTALQHGFIAQELEMVYPELVLTDSNGLKSVEYSSIISILTKALQEQQKQINNLKEEVEKLSKNKE